MEKVTIVNKKYLKNNLGLENHGNILRIYFKDGHIVEYPVKIYEAYIKKAVTESIKKYGVDFYENIDRIFFNDELKYSSKITHITKHTNIEKFSISQSKSLFFDVEIKFNENNEEATPPYRIIITEGDEIQKTKDQFYIICQSPFELECDVLTREQILNRFEIDLKKYNL